MIDINELLIFAKIVQHGSFTLAGQELSLPKSTISRKLSELEARLGVRLLQRTTRRLSLTDAGRVYYEYCARISGDADDAERAVTSMQGSPRGKLRVTAPLNFGFIGRIIGDFLLKYKEVRLELVCTDRMVNLIEEGFDVGIRAGALKDSSLVSRSLGALSSFLVASPTYLKKHGEPKRPQDLAEHSLMLFGAGSGRLGWQLQGCDKAMEVMAEARLIVNDQEMLLEAAVTGLGICMLPKFRCAELLRTKQLQRILPEWQSRDTPLSAVYPSAKHVSAKVKAFLEYLQAHLDPSAW